ncbi:hypothetical protein [Cupriavidus nantongensis]|uniref:hypothetical protein n=1 Tax=Cupriavidus nantongensis TaxID=1796606 RepID=UPI0012370C55|nr:hypothetical protein [Cupriavidus nantongensis]
MARALATSTVLALVSLLSITTSWAEGAPWSEIIAKIRSPAAFSVHAENKLSRHYRNTACLAFLLKKTKKEVGYLCSTRNEDFLRNFGVSAGPQGNPSENSFPRRNVSISSGVTSYPATPLELKSGATLYVAEVDCDLNNGAVYRPTGTCHVAIHYLRQGGILYSNFILEDHVGKKKWAKNDDIIALWESLPLAN